MDAQAEEIARLKRQLGELQTENERLRRRVEELLRALEEAQRAGKRQAAPFSRQVPKAHPVKPGRKAGEKYGHPCRRPIPKKIDECLESELPACCPHCGGELVETGIERQYQSEIPKPRVERIGFRIHVGRCEHCGRRVQGRHARQISDAVGGAASQLGARAVALATELNKGLGLSYGKTAAVLEEAFGLRVSRGGLSQALARVAKKAEPITVRADGDKLTFVSDEDSKSWNVVNPEALKGHEGHHVEVSAHVYADKGQIHVMSVKMLKAEKTDKKDSMSK